MSAFDPKRTLSDWPQKRCSARIPSFQRQFEQVKYPREESPERIICVLSSVPSCRAFVRSPYCRCGRSRRELLAPRSVWKFFSRAFRPRLVV